MSNPVRALRVARAWSQEQLAEMAGLSVRTVQRAENGAPSGLETLKSLAAVFEVDLDTLRCGDEATPNSQAEDKTMQDQIVANQADDVNNERSSAGTFEQISRRSITLVIILAMLVLVNYVTSPDFLWVKWPAFGIGLAILGMWAAWFSRNENREYDEKALKTPRELLKITGILSAAALALVVLNITTSPHYLWVVWPLMAFSAALIILWGRWALYLLFKH